MKRFAGLAPPLLLIAILLAVWEIACRAFHMPAYRLPAPSDVAASLAENAPLLVASAFVTLRTALSALILATLTGSILALAAALSPPIDKALRPLTVAAQVTPVVAIAPLLVIWAGLDHPERAVVALAAIVAFFPIYSGLLTGLKSADPDLERLFDLYGARPLQRLTRLRLPSAAPFALEGVKVAAGLSLVGAVVGEFAAGSGGAQGLAWRILEAGNRLQTAKMFAALFALSVMGAAVYAILEALQRAALTWWRGR